MSGAAHPMIANLMSRMDCLAGDMRSTVERSSPSTPHQRLLVRTMFAQIDLCTRYMTAGHRRFFDSAKVPPPEPNASIDAVLCGLSRAQAAALIDALRKEVPGE